MKTKHGIALSLVVIALSGCSTSQERKIASGSFAYIDSQEASMMEVPDGLDVPEFSREFELPELGENAPRNLIGQKLEVRSPSLVLPLVSGSRIEEGKKSATVQFDQIDDSQPLDATIWNTLLSFLEQNGIGVDSFDPEVGTLVTDWMLIRQEEDSSWYTWSSSESQTGRRFEFDLEMAAHGRSGALNVHLKDYLKTVDDDVVESIDDIYARNEEVDILNQVISHYDYQIGLENSRRIARIRKGLGTELGFNADGDPAIVIDAIYDVTRPRLQLVLKNLGFDVKDLDKSTGLLFITYNGAGGGWWSDIFSSDEELLKLGDYRLMVNEQGDKTSVTFMNEESKPFAANQVADLFDSFSEVMSKDNLDI